MVLAGGSPFATSSAAHASGSGVRQRGGGCAGARGIAVAVGDMAAASDGDGDRCRRSAARTARHAAAIANRRAIILAGVAGGAGVAFHGERRDASRRSVQCGGYPAPSEPQEGRRTR